MTRNSFADVPGALHDVMAGGMYGAKKNRVEDKEYVLRFCGNEEAGARSDYSRFGRKGIGQGSRPDVTGRGL